MSVSGDSYSSDLSLKIFYYEPQKYEAFYLYVSVADYLRGLFMKILCYKLHKYEAFHSYVSAIVHS